uniref:Uncharacterized protein n=1 Tax=viral metagenome TaxID=1070528 RepID=A0A6H1ZWT1_9ZZZZ
MPKTDGLDKYRVREGMVCIKCEVYSPDTARKGRITGYICSKCGTKFEESLKEWNKEGMFLTKK